MEYSLQSMLIGFLFVVRLNSVVAMIMIEKCQRTRKDFGTCDSDNCITGQSGPVSLLFPLSAVIIYAHSISLQMPHLSIFRQRRPYGPLTNPVSGSYLILPVTV